MAWQAGVAAVSAPCPQKAEAFAARSDTLACINSSTGLSLAFPDTIANWWRPACLRAHFRCWQAHVAVEEPDGKVVSYASLLRCSGALAAALRKAAAQKLQGSGPVALWLPRNRYAVALAIAAVEAGQGYLPCDEKLPAKRVLVMLRTAGAGLLVASRKLMEENTSEGAEKATLGPSFFQLTVEAEGFVTAAEQGSAEAWLTSCLSFTANQPGAAHLQRGVLPRHVEDENDRTQQLAYAAWSRLEETRTVAISLALGSPRSSSHQVQLDSRKGLLSPTDPLFI
ncbi:dtxS1 [Symbiodinium sp. CCMP2592]|nr:dtxS1 [Symbiodinium sp. CCMP2592]